MKDCLFFCFKQNKNLKKSQILTKSGLEVLRKSVHFTMIKIL